MKIRNRDGEECQISYNEIKIRIESLCTPEELKVLDIDRVVIQTINGIYDGITTSELDELSASVCAHLQSVHYMYDTLAGKILASNMHKNIRRLVSRNTFSGKIEHIEAARPKTFNDRFLEFVRKHSASLDTALDYKRDYNHNYFSTKTLQRAYLMHVDGQVIETAQDMWMRVAVAINCRSSIEDSSQVMRNICECYDNMSLGYFTHASPTLFNAGTRFEQMSSCYLLGTEDSINGIFKTISDCAMISKWAGGIGVHVSNIRAKGSLIESTNGRSDGIVPMLKVYNETARYCNQSGKRKGSIAIYLEPWHADVWEFLELRQNTGAETERARDLFMALWVPDEFMRRVRDGGDWFLMSPDKCPGLCDVYGKEFEDLYAKYVEEKRYIKKMPARTLWQHILKNLIETGTPYILFKDHVNRRTNHANLGTIRSSNLCVAPETRVLTSNGYRFIKELKDQEVEVWNGNTWSKTIIRQTGVDQPLLKVAFSNNEILECTPYHKFYVLARSVPADVPSDDGGWEAAGGKTKVAQGYALRVVRACDLKPGMEIQRLDAPVVVDPNARTGFKYAYTHGLFCAEGTYEGDFDTDMYEPRQCAFAPSEDSRVCKRHIWQECGCSDLAVDEEKRALATMNPAKCQALMAVRKPRISLYGEKKKLLEFVERRLDLEPYTDDAHDKITTCLPFDIAPKYFVPLGYTNDIKLRWFEGLCDGDGTIARNQGYNTLQVGSSELPFLREVRLMLNTLGVDPKISLSHEASEAHIMPDGHGGEKAYPRRACWRLLLTSADLVKLRTMGFAPKRLHMDNIPAEAPGDRRRHVQIVDIMDTGRTDDTYCFNEPLEHRGVFNGILSGQCAEICEYSDKDTYAVCNLASIAVNRYLEEDAVTGKLRYNHDRLHDIAKQLTRNLNKIIDWNMYPTPETLKSNMSTRPIGIGIQGVGDLFCRLKLAYDDPSAAQLEAEVMETIYHGALEASIELAQIDGPYPAYTGSPFSKGVLQFDMDWPSVHHRSSESKWNWTELKERLRLHGARNSLLTALMPTASTSQLLGNCEAFEPFHANVFKRTTIAGEFMVINKFLMKDLMDIGVWSDAMREALLRSDGSVQQLPGVPDEIRKVYKTVWEVPQRAVIDHAVCRAPYVDQSQSMNLFFAQPDALKLSSALLYGWSQGLKTGCYYLRSRPATEAIKYGLIGSTIPARVSGALPDEKKKVEDVSGPVCTRDEGCIMCSA